MKITKEMLVEAIEELNEEIVDPPIKETTEEGMRKKIIEAGTIVEEDDNLSKETMKIIKFLSSNKTNGKEQTTAKKKEDGKEQTTAKKKDEGKEQTTAKKKGNGKEQTTAKKKGKEEAAVKKNTSKKETQVSIMDKMLAKESSHNAIEKVLSSKFEKDMVWAKRRLYSHLCYKKNI